MRVRTLSSAVVFSFAVLAASATPAFAGGPGGAVAGTTSSAHPTKPKKKAAKKKAPATTGLTTAPVVLPPGASPITARTPSVAYSGPVYEKTATGAIVPYAAPATASEVSTTTGGSVVGTTAGEKPDLLVPGTLARYVNGLAAAPMGAPATVQEIIWAGNQIIGLPYIFGGGHASFVSPGYDCSGTVSFALHGAALLTTPEDSSEFETWGSHGVGTLGDGVRQPRPRLHGCRRPAPGHERRRRSVQPAGPALASAAPGKRRLRHPPPARPIAAAPRVCSVSFAAAAGLSIR